MVNNIAKLFWLLIVLLIISACTNKPQNYWVLKAEPSSISHAAEKGNSAILILLSNLGNKRTDHNSDSLLKEVTARHERAPIMISSIANEHGVAMGITSGRLRNPDNAPPDWALRYIQLCQTDNWKDETIVFDLKEKVGLLKPVAAQKTCLSCHGPVESFPPELKAKIIRMFPNDKATGYKNGELIGFIWAEVIK